MKTGIGALVAGIVGVIGILLFLVAFGTEYWLLATEEGVFGDSSRGVLTFHHEGFFWRCWFSGEGTHGNVWKFWFTNQPRTKHCRPGYLFPMPIALGPLPHPSYDATAVYRGFWTVFIVLGVTASLVGVFLLVCGAPFVNARLYKFGGIFLLTSGKMSSDTERRTVCLGLRTYGIRALPSKGEQERTSLWAFTFANILGGSTNPLQTFTSCVT
uniref:Uncharacterized protein n=1 Tax=Vombatus ursinus TaxID=29139 RepID=A0A4X2KZ00_VOMUR